MVTGNSMPTMQHNLLQVPLRDFKHAMKPFTPKRRKLGQLFELETNGEWKCHFKTG